MIQLPIVNQPPAVLAAGQRENAVIVFSHNRGPDYTLIDPTKPGCAYVIETCYCPPNADGTPGDQRMEMYLEYQRAGTGQDRKSTRLNSSHMHESRMPSSA